MRLWELKLEFGQHFVWIKWSAKYLVNFFMHRLDVMCNVFEVDGPILFIISFGSEAGDWNYSRVKPLISTWRCITLPPLKAPSLYKLLSLLTNFNHTRRAWRAWLYCHGNGRCYGLGKMKENLFLVFLYFDFVKESILPTTVHPPLVLVATAVRMLALSYSKTFPVCSNVESWGCSKCTIN